MKNLNRLSFSKVLTKSELKQIKGGYMCVCSCVGSVGTWIDYAQSSSCSSKTTSSHCASGKVQCVDAHS